MKKLIKVFSLIIVLVLTMTCTSCSVTENYEKGKSITEVSSLNDQERQKLEDTEKFIGYLYWDEENPGEAVIYRTYQDANESGKEKSKIYVISSKSSDKFGDTYSLPKLASGLSVGTNFKGWFKVDENGNSVRVTTVADLENAGLVHAEYIDYAESGLVVLVCITIVFLMLALLCGIVSLFKFFAPKEKAEEKNDSPQVVEPKKKLKLEDITDDDMMAAALVASIDYHNEIKEDVRVVSITEIK